MSRTYYYLVHSDGTLSKAYSDMGLAQVAVADSGVAHHVTDILAITYKEGAGCIDCVERTGLHPVWWKHWRDLEITMKNIGRRPKP